MSVHAESAERTGRSGARKAERGDDRAAVAGLDLLRAVGWLVLHDVAVPGDVEVPIDHVLAGPSGVYAINTIGGSGAIRMDEKSVLVAGVSQLEHVQDVASAALALHEVINGRPVVPILCFARGDEVAGVVNKVAVCSTENILELLNGQPRVLDAAAVNSVMRTLNSTLARQSVTRPVAVVAEAPAAKPKHRDRVRGAKRLLGFGKTSDEDAPVALSVVAPLLEAPAAPQVDVAALEAERVAIEEAARIEAERVAAEEAARVEAERVAAEEAARVEAERLAAEEAARVEAARLEAEAAARVEAERLAAEEAARVEAERVAAEEAARVEAARLEAEEAARVEAERLAAEEAARVEAERVAAEEAARVEAARLEAEEAARVEAERLAAEEAARLEAEEAARVEAERLAAEEAAREESARLEAELAVQVELEDEPEVTPVDERPVARQTRGVDSDDPVWRPIGPAAKRVDVKSAVKMVSAAFARRDEEPEFDLAEIEETFKEEQPGQTSLPAWFGAQAPAPAAPVESPVEETPKKRKVSLMPAVVAAAVVALIFAVVPRVPDAYAWGKGFFVDPPVPTLGQTTVIASTGAHPAIQMTAGVPLAVKSVNGASAGKGRHWVGVPIRAVSKGPATWNLPVATGIKIVDTLGVTHVRSAAVTRISTGKVLAKRVSMAPGRTIAGMVVIALENGREISSVQVTMSQFEPVVTWKAPTAGS